MSNLIRLTHCVPDADADALRARLVGDDHYDVLIRGEDARVLRPDGSPLIVFRSRAVPAAVWEPAFPALLRAAKPSLNRGDAAGGRYRRVKRDGTRSNTSESRPVRSGTAGYLERDPRAPICRATAYTREDAEGWAAVVPFVRAINEAFRRGCPDRYAAQLAVVRQTPPAYVIPGTVFTTMTVNRNFRTHVHKDEGDLPQGFGVMCVVEAGEYDGGYLVFPKWRVAVDLRAGDVLLADVHEWHGNTELVGVEGEYDRVSVVLYYRSEMRHCLPPDEELRWAKRRRQGDPFR
jgi:Oxygenase domain of the 2OGFeDO superfamily